MRYCISYSNFPALVPFYMIYENTTETFVKQLKNDDLLANTLSSYLIEWDTTTETLYGYVAYFARELGYEVDVEILKEILADALPEDIQSLLKPKRMKRPAGPLSPTVNPKSIGTQDRSTVFSHMYSRVGRKMK